MATVLKTVVRKDRGFESLSLRPAFTVGHAIWAPRLTSGFSPIAPGNASAYREVEATTRWTSILGREETDVGRFTRKEPLAFTGVLQTHR